MIAVAQAAADAYRAADIAALEELLASDITVVDPNSRVITRPAILEAIRAGAIKYNVFANRDVQARVYGDTAIVVGITEAKGTLLGQPFSAEVRFTDVMVRLQGKWKLVATHTSHMPPR